MRCYLKEIIYMIFMDILAPFSLWKIKRKTPRADSELLKRIMFGLKMVHLPRPFTLKKIFFPSKPLK